MSKPYLCAQHSIFSVNPIAPCAYCEIDRLRAELAVAEETLVDRADRITELEQAIVTIRHGAMRDLTGEMLDALKESPDP